MTEHDKLQTVSCSSVSPLDPVCTSGSELWRTSVLRGSIMGPQGGNSQVRSRAPCAMLVSSQCKVSLSCKCNNAPLLAEISINLGQWAETGTQRTGLSGFI